VAVGLAYAGVSMLLGACFVWEGGWWRYHLSEEKRIFMPSVPYEEFVGAQQ
jgi:hypothetical protein